VNATLALASSGACDDVDVSVGRSPCDGFDGRVFERVEMVRSRGGAAYTADRGDRIDSIESEWLCFFCMCKQ
jgi:hypothetical protein